MRLMLCLAALLVIVAPTNARSRRTSTCTTCSSSLSCANGACTQTTTTTTESVSEGLAEVNAARAARGLRPFVHDPLLTQGAVRAALERARARLSGHLANDFACLPAGARATAAGCAAWPQGMGFGACAMYENWTYAGAASVRGPDGRMYHHLFVR